jgi:hypothetical protein
MRTAGWIRKHLTKGVAKYTQAKQLLLLPHSTDHVNHVLLLRDGDA